MKISKGLDIFGKGTLKCILEALILLILLYCDLPLVSPIFLKHFIRYSHTRGKQRELVSLSLCKELKEKSNELRELLNRLSTEVVDPFLIPINLNLFRGSETPNESNWPIIRLAT